MCLCVCVHLNVHHKDMLFYDGSRYSRYRSCKMAFPAKGLMFLMFFKLNKLMYCFTQYIALLVYTPHKKAKKYIYILFIPIISLLIHRQASKCAHKAKPLHTFKFFFMVSSVITCPLCFLNNGSTR